MKRIYTKILMLSSLAAVLASCAYDPYKTDIPKVEETMNLSASAEAIVLTEDNLKDLKLAFSWTPARHMPEEYQLTYTAEMDVVGNNFGSETVISSGTGFDFEYDEAAGLYSCSFTGEQINNWYNDRWKLPVNADFSLEFRVVAQWDGGSTYEMPEVRQVTVKVTPIQVIVFDADEMSIAGTAIASETEIFPTLENTNQYAWYGDLTPGELLIPVVYEGGNYYISPVGDGTLKDGEADNVDMITDAKGWTIANAGKYRVVINMETRQVTIYSEATDIRPLTVKWHPNADPERDEVTTEVTNLWVVGESGMWGGTNLNCTQSPADPQILYYTVDKDNVLNFERVKFVIAISGKDADGETWNQNNAYCYSCGVNADGAAQDVTVNAGEWTDMVGDATSAHKNSYFRITKGSYNIIFDLRNNRIRFDAAQ